MEVHLEDVIFCTPHKIIKVPDGPEPDEVRNAWVGLEVMAARFDHPFNWKIVVGDEILVPVNKGYVVPIERALEVLEDTSPEAGRWYRENVPKAGALSFGLDEFEPIPLRSS